MGDFFFWMQVHMLSLQGLIDDQTSGPASGSGMAPGDMRTVPGIVYGIFLFVKGDHGNK